MKGSQKTILASIGILIVCSCANNERWNDIRTVQVIAQATKSTKTQTLEKNAPQSAAPPYDITVDMEFMDTTIAINAEVSRKINTELIREFLSLNNEYESNHAVKAFINQLQTQYENDENSSEIYDHYTGKAQFGFDGVINYFFTEEYYGGGAHPNSVTSIQCFNTQTGDKINLNQLITDTCTISLSNRLTERLMKKVGVPSLDSLHSLGYLDNVDMFVSDNFILDKDSIHFYYNQYDIAPYAAGPITLSFSYEELKDYIRR